MKTHFLITFFALCLIGSVNSFAQEREREYHEAKYVGPKTWKKESKMYKKESKIGRKMFHDRYRTAARKKHKSLKKAYKMEMKEDRYK